MTTASGVLSYTDPQLPADAEVGGSLHSASLGSRSPWTAKEHPETGNKIEGWKWDQRVWPDSSIENVNGYVPRIFDAVQSGLLDEYYQSGIGSGGDLEVQNIRSITASGISDQRIPVNHWCPEVEHGWFYDYSQSHYLFSDDSVVFYPLETRTLTGLEDDYSFIAFSGLLKPGVPVMARIYEWDADTAEYDIDTEYRIRTRFTGLLNADGIELDTVDVATGAILFQNIDNTEPEAIVIASGIDGACLPVLVFNQNASKQVGTVTASGIPDISTIDILGFFEAPGQALNTLYSPVDIAMPARVFSWPTNDSGAVGTTVEWATVTSGETLTGYQVFLDYDLGLVRFADPADMPTANNPTIGDAVGACYYKTPCVEIEYIDTSDTVTGTGTKLNPIERHHGSAFVCLTPRDMSPASITLSVELPALGTDYYGPLHIGSTYAAVVATVCDTTGAPIEGIEVSFDVLEPYIGSFGVDGSAVAVTDENGQARVFYVPPVTIEDLGEEVPASRTTVTGTSTTFRTIELPIATIDPDNPTDVFLYAIYGDDPIQGYLSDSVSLTDADAQVHEYYRAYFASEDIWGPTGQDGVGTTTQEAVHWEDAWRILWDLARPAIYGLGGGGRRMLVSDFDGTAINPHNPTGGGAWVPKQPMSVTPVSATSYDVAFDTTSVSIPAPTGDLRAYLIVSPTVVQVQASVYSTRLHRTLISTPASIRLDVPDHMSGVWTIDDINNINIDELSSLITVAMEGKKLPLGFRLRSGTITLAAALDSVTFLDINSTVTPSLEPSTWPMLGHKITIT